MIVACRPGQDTCFATMTIIEASYLAQTEGQLFYQPKNFTLKLYQVIVEKGCAKRADLAARKLKDRTRSLVWSTHEDNRCHQTLLQTEHSPKPNGNYPKLESLNFEGNPLLRLSSKDLFKLSNYWVNEEIREKYGYHIGENAPKVKERLPKIEWQSEICTCNWDQCNSSGHSSHSIVAVLMMFILSLII